MSLSKFFSNPIPPPAFTQISLIDLSSKVYIVTNCTSPSTLCLAKILYNLHATVYINSPSPATYSEVTTKLALECPDSKGTLKPFNYNPTNKLSIEQAVQIFLNEEWRLDVLFLNTTYSPGNEDSATCLSSFLLAKLLLPRMQITASHFCHPNPSIRTVWISDNNAPRNLYGRNSVESLYLLAHEFSRRKFVEVYDAHEHTLPNSNPSGVQHVVVDAYILESSLKRYMRGLVPVVIKGENYGVCTLLYAGLAPDVRGGDWVIPWGRKTGVPGQIAACTVRTDEGKSVSEDLYCLLAHLSENLDSRECVSD